MRRLPPRSTLLPHSRRAAVNTVNRQVVALRTAAASVDRTGNRRRHGCARYILSHVPGHRGGRAERAVRVDRRGGEADGALAVVEAQTVEPAVAVVVPGD